MLLIIGQLLNKSLHDKWIKLVLKDDKNNNVVVSAINSDHKKLNEHCLTFYRVYIL